MKMPPQPNPSPEIVKEEKIQDFIRRAKGGPTKRKKRTNADRVKRGFWLDKKDVWLIEKERLRRLRKGEKATPSAIVRDAIKVSLSPGAHRDSSGDNQPTGQGEGLYLDDMDG